MFHQENEIFTGDLFNYTMINTFDDNYQGTIRKLSSLKKSCQLSKN